MPWKNSSVVTERKNFIEAVLAREGSFRALCARFGISRRVGYKWLERYRKAGEKGLRDASRRPPPRRPNPAQQRWREAILAERKKRGAGPKKLLWRLRKEHPRAGQLPSQRSIARRLKAEGCIGPRQRRSRRGPQIPRPAGRPARASNDVWTVDLKGSFRTADGARCEPLTIRDLHSRYVLWVEHVCRPSEKEVRAAMTRCFGAYGLPKAIRVDNGAPFGGRGALGLTRLSVWWIRLGIRVEFIRRAKPQDNGAHEQMHRVLKAQSANPPAATLRAQHRRFAVFVRSYNEERPHESLAMRTPAQLYTRSRRHFAEPVALCYRRGWEIRRVRPGGPIQWAGKARLIGRAFAGENIGLKPIGSAAAKVARAQSVEVYLGSLLIGQLHADDLAGMRPAQWVTPAP
jgi:transposase InsO family protein